MAANNEDAPQNDPRPGSVFLKVLEKKLREILEDISDKGLTDRYDMLFNMDKGLTDRYDMLFNMDRDDVNAIMEEAVPLMNAVKEIVDAKNNDMP